MNIYVSNLSFNVTDEDLHDYFAEYGEVSSAKVIMDKFTNKSRGFAFVEMSDDEAAKKAIIIESEAKEEAEKKAKKIISLAMARYAGEYTSERTVGVIALPSDEMKGRVIGKEGRNIRALEAACGVDLIVDETPEAVVISSFDPVRREIARRTLEVLLQDGRVHPARIEEVVEKVKADYLNTLKNWATRLVLI